jgi:hypothetical protein
LIITRQIEVILQTVIMHSTGTCHTQAMSFLDSARKDRLNKESLNRATYEYEMAAEAFLTDADYKQLVVMLTEAGLEVSNDDLAKSFDCECIKRDQNETSPPVKAPPVVSAADEAKARNKKYDEEARKVFELGWGLADCC